MQVLYTQAGQPMTLLLSVAKTKAVRWSSRLGLGTLAFLFLWGAVSVLSGVLQKKHLHFSGTGRTSRKRPAPVVGMKPDG